MISGREIAAAWRYSVKKDYTSSDGHIKTVELHPKHASRSISIETASKGYGYSHSINPDGTLLAISSGAQIKLYDLQDGTLMNKIKGHTSDIAGLHFCPTRSNLLVSGSEGMQDGRRSLDGVRSEIIIWDLDNLGEKDGIATEEEIRQLSGETVDWISGQLDKRGFALRLGTTQREEVQAKVDKLLSRYQTATLIDPSQRIEGRLPDSFHSPVSNEDGTKLIYLPGERPHSNGDDQWDIVVRNLNPDDGEDTTLSGNRDSIMGVKYSPDGRLIVSICWDGHFRLWDTATGETRHAWKTGKQNWAGVFSPDSSLFLGTDGEGMVRVWDVSSGDLKWEWEYGQWCRAVDWSDDGRWIAVGGQGHARLIIFKIVDGDFAKPPEMIHERIMGDDVDPEAFPDERHRSFAGHMNEVDRVMFLPRSAGGRKVVSTCQLDKAVEVFDLESNTKWRIFHGDAGEANGHSCGFYWLESEQRLVTVGRETVRFWQLG